MADAVSNDDIQVECSETSTVERSLSVEVAAPRVKKAFDRAYKELARTSRVKGFRPGKAPRSVLEKMYGASMPEEIEQSLVRETLPGALAKAEVMPIVEPEVDAETPTVGEAFRYTARIEVKPEIGLPELSGLEAKRPRLEVRDEEIDDELERMRQGRPDMVEEEEGVQAADGHTVTLDFAGKVDGELFEGGSGQGMEVEIGGGNMVPGFEEQLTGVKSGDDCQVTITFPDDYGPENLNGKEAVFDCHIVAIRRKQLRELDDEFAKDMGEHETLESMRDEIRSNIGAQHEKNAESMLHRTLMDSLIERADFEVPGGFVEMQLQNQLRSTHEQFQGRVPDDVLQQQLSRMQEDGRPTAERRVREALLLEAIANANDISVSEEDVNARLEEMAGTQGMEAGQLRTMAEQQGWLGSIEMELREKSAYGYLASLAKIEEVEDEAAVGEPIELDDE